MVQLKSKCIFLEKGMLLISWPCICSGKLFYIFSTCRFNELVSQDFLSYNIKTCIHRIVCGGNQGQPYQRRLRYAEVLTKIGITISTGWVSFVCNFINISFEDFGLKEKHLQKKISIGMQKCLYTRSESLIQLKIPQLLRDTKVNYRVHKIQPLVPNLSQMNPSPLSLCNIKINILKNSQTA